MDGHWGGFMGVGTLIITLGYVLVTALFLPMGFMTLSDVCLLHLPWTS